MSVYKTLLHAPGRINQKQFFVGLAVFAVFYGAQIIAMGIVGTSLLGFFLAMTFLCLNLYMLYCLFGKRLHDTGRSVAPFFGMLAALIVLAIFLQLQSGGLEYFDTIMANPDRQNDEAWMQQQHVIYQERLAGNMPHVRWFLWLPPLLLTLFAGLKKGDKGENRYGNPRLD